MNGLAKPVKILVVDDDKEIAELVEIHLVGDGYEVFKAYSAKDTFSLQNIKKQLYNCFFS